MTQVKKMKLTKLLHSKNPKLCSIKTQWDLCNFVHNLNPDCGSDKWKREFLKTLSSLIFNNAVEVLSGERTSKQKTLAEAISTTIGDAIRDGREPPSPVHGFSRGVQDFVARVLSTWLGKSVADICGDGAGKTRGSGTRSDENGFRGGGGGGSRGKSSGFWKKRTSTKIGGDGGDGGGGGGGKTKKSKKIRKPGGKNGTKRSEKTGGPSRTRVGGNAEAGGKKSKTTSGPRVADRNAGKGAAAKKADAEKASTTERAAGKPDDETNDGNGKVASRPGGKRTGGTRSDENGNGNASRRTKTSDGDDDAAKADVSNNTGDAGRTRTRDELIDDPMTGRGKAADVIELDGDGGIGARLDLGTGLETDAKDDGRYDVAQVAATGSRGNSNNARDAGARQSAVSGGSWPEERRAGAENESASVEINEHKFTAENGYDRVDVRRTGDDDRRTGNDDRRTGSDGRWTDSYDRLTGNDDRRTGNDDRRTGNDDRRTGNNDRRTGNNDQRTGNDSGQSSGSNGLDQTADKRDDFAVDGLHDLADGGHRLADDGRDFPAGNVQRYPADEWVEEEEKWYSDDAGSSSCVERPDDWYSDDAGSSSCVERPDAWSSDDGCDREDGRSYPGGGPGATDVDERRRGWDDVGGVSAGVANSTSSRPRADNDRSRRSEGSRVSGQADMAGGTAGRTSGGPPGHDDRARGSGRLRVSDQADTVGGTAGRISGGPSGHDDRARRSGRSRVSDQADMAGGAAGRTSGGPSGHDDRARWSGRSRVSDRADMAGGVAGRTSGGPPGHDDRARGSGRLRVSDQADTVGGTAGRTSGGPPGHDDRARRSGGSRVSGQANTVGGASGRTSGGLPGDDYRSTNAAADYSRLCGHVDDDLSHSDDVHDEKSVDGVVGSFRRNHEDEINEFLNRILSANHVTSEHDVGSEMSTENCTELFRNMTQTLTADETERETSAGCRIWDLRHEVTYQICKNGCRDHDENRTLLPPRDQRPCTLCPMERAKRIVKVISKLRDDNCEGFDK